MLLENVILQTREVERGFQRMEKWDKSYSRVYILHGFREVVCAKSNCSNHGSVAERAAALRMKFTSGKSLSSDLVGPRHILPSGGWLAPKISKIHSPEDVLDIF